MRWGGERIPHVVEMSRNTEMERGYYDQQVATYQLGNSTHEDADYQIPLNREM
jgi:hypothetical protein